MANKQSCLDDQRVGHNLLSVLLTTGLQGSIVFSLKDCHLGKLSLKKTRIFG